MIGRQMILSGAAMAVLALGGAYAKGWADRGAREADRMAALEAARRVDAGRIMGLAEALERARNDRAALVKELEHAAVSDDESGRVALPARSVRRIDGR